MLGGERVRWINTYGPTEATVIATAHEPEGAIGHEIPIGRPIANVTTYVLDAQHRPLPVGVAGELYIGGAGVGLGYWNRPDLTAERFLPDPFATHSGARLFKTGDRVRWLADGRLEFLGRRDEQVKIRGYRVEPGEIEAVLLAQPGIDAAAVVAAVGTDGDARLHAYFVAVPAVDRLRRSLRGTLPAPMIPSTFTRLSALPMTPTGKTDRRALPVPDVIAEPPVVSIAPRDAIELKLAEVWEEVLGVPSLSVTESFFDLGGHSLLAIRLLARVEEAFGRRLPLPTLFLGPTIEDQANLLRVPAATPGEWSPIVPIGRPGANHRSSVSIPPAASSIASPIWPARGRRATILRSPVGWS